MPAAQTYEPIATTTIASAVSSYTFSSISGSYTDLILVGSFYSTVNDVGVYARFNSDTGTNYSNTVLVSNGTTAQSQRNSSNTFMNVTAWNVGLGSTNGIYSPAIFNVMNYANTTTYKTTITRGSSRSNDGSGETMALAGLWRSTSAINSIQIYYSSGNLAVGTSMTLYGIKAA